MQVLVKTCFSILISKNSNTYLSIYKYCQSYNIFLKSNHFANYLLSLAGLLFGLVDERSRNIATAPPLRKSSFTKGEFYFPFLGNVQTRYQLVSQPTENFTKQQIPKKILAKRYKIYSDFLNGTI